MQTTISKTEWLLPTLKNAHVVAPKRTKAPLILPLIFLLGCAGMVMDVDTLRAQGYQRSPMTYITAIGERRESPNYDLWWKESREAGRTAHFCLVPKTAGPGYNWRITVYVDDKETWSYESGPLFGRPSLRVAPDCTVSGPLPEGRLFWRVWYTYWK